MPNAFKSTEISGSITRLVDGTSLLVAGPNITINSGSNGQITISGSAAGASAGGSDTEIQFNNNNNLSGSINFKLNPTGSAGGLARLELSGTFNTMTGSAGGLSIQGNGSNIAAGFFNVNASDAGSFAQGFYTVIASGFGTFAQGFLNVTASDKGAFAQGCYGVYATQEACFAQGEGSVIAGGGGAFAQGKEYVSALADGTFAQGRSYTISRGPYSFAQGGVYLLADGTGSFVQGTYNISATNNASMAQGSNTIRATGVGSFAQGYRFVSSTAGGTFAQGANRVSATASGSFAQGFNPSGNGSGSIEASGPGSFAHGFRNIFAVGSGSFAAGMNSESSLKSDVEIRSSGKGSFAFGYVNHFDFPGPPSAGGAYIKATGFGSHASGYVYGYGYYNNNILSDGAGGFAHGYIGQTASGFYQKYIRAKGKGSVAFGSLDDNYAYEICASGTNSFQLGPGTNRLPMSIMVGSKDNSGVAKGLRFGVSQNDYTGPIGIEDAGDLANMLAVKTPAGNVIPTFPVGTANETKLVYSGTILELQEGITNFGAAEFTGKTVHFGTGSITRGKVHYLSQSGSTAVWSVANAASGSAFFSGSLTAVAVGNSARDGMLIDGYYSFASGTLSSGSYSIGDTVYLASGSNAAGTGVFITVPPATSGSIVRTMGHVIHSSAGARIIRFNPSNDWLEI